MSTEEIKKKKSTFRKEIAAISIIEAMTHLDEWAHSCYDMYLISMEPYEEREGYLAMVVFGWENDETRETFSV